MAYRPRLYNVGRLSLRSYYTGYLRVETLSFVTCVYTLTHKQQS